MKACMEENGMKFSDEQIEDLTLALFEDADTQRQGAITYESLKAQLLKHPGLLENLSISIDRWLVPPNLGNKEAPKTTWDKFMPYQMSLPYLKNNYVYLFFLFIYISVNLGLFIARAIQFQDDNGLYIVARACGQCLNFNCMFVLVLMLRQCITYLRSMGASAILPLDQHMYLHKLCGWVIFIFSFVHTLMHCINFPLNIVPDKSINTGNFTTAEWLFTMKPGLFGLIPGIANPSGVALMIILTLMVICSQPFVRKSGYFEVFYWTHLLYIVFFILTILHGPRFWMWFVAPGVIFLIERIHRTIRMRTGRGKTHVSSGVLLPSKVIHLVIKRPLNFHFHPGDYVFVNIPAIAKYEWHPFTISSAPEHDEEIWLHIRAVGEWTNRLYRYFEREQEKCERLKGSVQGNGYNNDTCITVRVDDARDLQCKNNLLRVSNAPKMDAISESSFSEDTSSTRAIRKNGITNQAFEPDTNGNTYDNENGQSLASTPTAMAGANDISSETPDMTSSRKRLGKTHSVPDLNIRQKTQGNGIVRERTMSEKRFRESALENACSEAFGNGHKKAVCRSIRYIRRPPKVITLDVPSDQETSDSETEQTTEQTMNSKIKESDTRVDMAESEVSGSPVADGAVVAAEEGRIRKLSKQEQQEQDRQRRISRQEERRNRRKSIRDTINASGGCASTKKLVIFVDGPFGAPSSHIFHAQHAVLIATGIGVTPFASILQSIMHKYWKVRHTCPKCSHSWTSDLPKTVMNLKKVDFFWINRDQRSFEWFVNLLSQLEIEQAEQGGVLDRFLDMHMYITSALQKTDMKAVGLQLALDLLHKKEKRDLITGLKTRTNAGRPNWDKV
ncbi:NADPH oxidase 5 [Halocaridina rubra]|uniref:NADPH oxidase 5 n=1 Tax=Halocaridina rubra TaxID=373956 RepID=A0AAN9A593_HALRR